MTHFQIRAMVPPDAAALLRLYVAAASVPGCGLARQPDEMSPGYFAALLAPVGGAAVSLGAFAEGRLLGEIHAWRMAPRQFSHVLTDLTVAVAPDAQGGGIGRTLFGHVFTEAARLAPRITRIELIARSGNARAIAFYETLGFAVEGRFAGRVILPDGTVEDDIPMAKRL